METKHSWKAIIITLCIGGIFILFAKKCSVGGGIINDSPQELQEQQAKETIKRRFRQSPEGDSYKPVAWGGVEVNAPRAGTGTKNAFYGEIGTPPSPYSMTHRLRMRNGFGNITTYDIRVYFTDKSCKEWEDMEYMDKDDPNRYLMEEE